MYYRLIGQVLHLLNTPKCSLEFIHRSRVGEHQSEVSPVGDSADMSANWGAKSDYLASGRNRTYNLSVKRGIINRGARMLSTEQRGEFRFFRRAIRRGIRRSLRLS